MPSPVGHVLAGCCIAAAAAGRAPALRSPAFIAALVVAANLPDIDFAGALFGPPAAVSHQGGTHSLAFVLAAALPLAWAARRSLPLGLAWRWIAAAGVTHLLLDLVCHDGSLPVGIPLAWPFSDARWHSPVDLFPGTDRRRLLSLTNLRELLAELAWLLPVLAFLLRGRLAGLLRREAPGRADAAADACRRTGP